MTAITLHLATTPADHARLAQLAHTIWYEHYPAIIGIAQVNYMLARGYSVEALAAEQRAGTRFVLAYQNDTAIGLAATTPAPSPPINGLGSSSKPKTSRISAGAMSWATI